MSTTVEAAERALGELGVRVLRTDATLSVVDPADTGGVQIALTDTPPPRRPAPLSGGGSGPGRIAQEVVEPGRAAPSHEVPGMVPAPPAGHGQDAGHGDAPPEVGHVQILGQAGRREQTPQNQGRAPSGGRRSPGTRRRASTARVNQRTIMRRNGRR